ncbi:MAG: hypothetical protein KC482_16855 [Dehalococcoidia bacterium]|nr:hypothetical protein [Dehalococcoidia bacterium]
MAVAVAEAGSVAVARTTLVAVTLGTLLAVAATVVAVGVRVSAAAAVPVVVSDVPEHPITVAATANRIQAPTKSLTGSIPSQKKGRGIAPALHSRSARS